jgi:hypothetical protein
MSSYHEGATEKGATSAWSDTRAAFGVSQRIGDLNGGYVIWLTDQSDGEPGRGIILRKSYFSISVVQFRMIERGAGLVSSVLVLMRKR